MATSIHALTDGKTTAEFYADSSDTVWLYFKRGGMVTSSRELDKQEARKEYRDMLEIGFTVVK